MSKYNLTEVKEAIIRNGGNIGDQQIAQIHAQLLKGVVPNTFICIATGATKGCSNSTLRAKRLANAAGETHEEKLFNLLTGYKSQAAEPKRMSSGPRSTSKKPVVFERVGSTLDDIFKHALLGDKDQIVHGSITVFTGEGDKFKTITFSGNQVGQEEFEQAIAAPAEPAPSPEMSNELPASPEAPTEATPEAPTEAPVAEAKPKSKKKGKK